MSLTSTMCKLFERMNKHWLGFRVEKEQWISRFQHGFRRGRSALNGVSTITTEIMWDLGDGESTLAPAVDIKVAFNSVLPGVLIQNLKELCIAAKVINNISFLANKTRLFFFRGSVS